MTEEKRNAACLAIIAAAVAGCCLGSHFNSASLGFALFFSLLVLSQD